MTYDTRPIPHFEGYAITRDGIVFHHGRSILPRGGNGPFRVVLSYGANGRTSRRVDDLVNAAWNGGHIEPPVPYERSESTNR